MDHIRVSKIKGVARIRILSKTMPPAFFREFKKAVEKLSKQASLRVLIISSVNPHFSYGLDLTEAFKEFGDLMSGGGLAEPRSRLRQLIHDLQSTFTALEACPFPTIAAVNGWCIGGGLDLITACDIRLASQDAKISLRETKIAFVADLGSLQRLPPIIGEGNARLMAFSGKDITAYRALGMGLVSEIYENKEELDLATTELANEIAENPPLTVQGVKQVLNYGRDHSVADGLEYVSVWNSAFLASEDLAEAVSAFMMKRSPVFKGK